MNYNNKLVPPEWIESHAESLLKKLTTGMDDPVGNPLWDWIGACLFDDYIETYTDQDVMDVISDIFTYIRNPKIEN